MSRPMPKAEAAIQAQAQAAYVSDHSLTAVGLLVHLARQIREEADANDGNQVCGNTDCGTLASYAEWVSHKLQEELTDLRNSAKAAGWMQD